MVDATRGTGYGSRQPWATSAPTSTPTQTPGSAPTSNPTPTSTLPPASAPAPTLAPTAAPTLTRPAATAERSEIVTFGPTGTAAALVVLMIDMTVDVIEVAAGTYSGWHLGGSGEPVFAFSRKARPLLVRPAPGAAVIWDGSGVPQGDGWFYAVSGVLKNNTSTGGTNSPIILAPMVDGAGNSRH